MIPIDCNRTITAHTSPLEVADSTRMEEKITKESKQEQDRRKRGTCNPSREVVPPVTTSRRRSRDPGRRVLLCPLPLLEPSHRTHDHGSSTKNSTRKLRKTHRQGPGGIERHQRNRIRRRERQRRTGPQAASFKPREEQGKNIKEISGDRMWTGTKCGLRRHARPVMEQGRRREEEEKVEGVTPNTHQSAWHREDVTKPSVSIWLSADDSPRSVFRVRQQHSDPSLDSDL
ncbi:hypothetical protein BHE74_00014309 [Ensete ventricosum]|nr:hypothetical protein GW17_00028015 [Ensete ventricosum]RWW77529.1 hypothetical protein BHE74_00014309 [Ensete ventricosum]RZS04601.1 hypothetical protein BHM03_00034958 [Ensete ventricosum]